MRVNPPCKSFSTQCRPDQTIQAELELSGAEFSCHVESRYHFRVAQVTVVAVQSSLLPLLHEGESEKREYLSRPLEDIH
jgi:hypothetical protein